jgi:hypothetical protein
MANQTIAKPLGLIRDLKIFVHCILCKVIFIVINNNVVASSYWMLLGCQWLKDVKVSHKEIILLPYKERYNKNHTCYQEI